MAGGEVTPLVDAAAAMDQTQHNRILDSEVEAGQQAGQVDLQNTSARPAAEHPEGGMPHAPAAPPHPAPLQDGEAPPATAETVSLADELVTARDQLLRLAADFQNFKRLAAQREQEARERAVQGLLLDLLPVLDNFERAVEAAHKTSDLNSLRIGVEYILQQLQDVLKQYHIEEIPAAGRRFDPAHHDAVEEVHGSGQEPGTVVHESQRGYLYKGRLLRPSRVKVAGQAPPPDDISSSEAEESESK